MKFSNEQSYYNSLIISLVLELDNSHNDLHEFTNIYAYRNKQSI